MYSSHRATTQHCSACHQHRDRVPKSVSAQRTRKHVTFSPVLLTAQERIYKTVVYLITAEIFNGYTIQPIATGDE